jgi:hypothetical protein
MPHLHVYQHEEFPSNLKWQAISFIRVQWPSVFTGPLRWLTEPYPPAMHPIHFALSEGDVLISYAAALRLALPHQDTTYQVYGFGNVFTFPPYRHGGYGQQVMQAAAQYLDASAVDLAILFCQPLLEPFYAQSGWEACHAAETRIGTADSYTLDHDLRMMRFISPQAKQARSEFVTQPLYIKWSW